MNTKLSLTATTTFAGGGHLTIEATDVPIDSGYLHELVSVLFEAPAREPIEDPVDDLVASYERKQAEDGKQAAELRRGPGSPAWCTGRSGWS